MKKQEKKYIEYISIPIAILFAIYLIFIGPNFLDVISLPEFSEFSLDSDFEKFGVGAIFVYEFIPEGFRFIGISGIYFALIDSGVSDVILLLVPAAGKIIGELILFGIGVYLFRKFKFKHKLLDQFGKQIHKHKYIAFFIVPFAGMGGAFIMIVAGHEKINFLKILPILVVANILDVALWLYPTLAQMQVTSLFS